MAGHAWWLHDGWSQHPPFHITAPSERSLRQAKLLIRPAIRLCLPDTVLSATMSTAAKRSLAAIAAVRSVAAAATAAMTEKPEDSAGGVRRLDVAQAPGSSVLAALLVNGSALALLNGSAGSAGRASERSGPAVRTPLNAASSWPTRARRAHK